MANRTVHYEAAFEDCLRSCGRAYISVDEQKRSIFGGLRVKSFDFLVQVPGGARFLIDVKGRQARLAPGGQLGYLQTWSTLDDIAGLQQWERIFGQGSCGVLVFAYELFGLPDVARVARELDFGDEVHVFRDSAYLFRAVLLREYVQRMKRRSAKWQTLDLPAASFRQMSRPLRQLWSPAVTQTLFDALPSGLG